MGEGGGNAGLVAVDAVVALGEGVNVSVGDVVSVDVAAGDVAVAMTAGDVAVAIDSVGVAVARGGVGDDATGMMLMTTVPVCVAVVETSVPDTASITVNPNVSESVASILAMYVN